VSDWRELLEKAKSAIASGRTRQGLQFCDLAAVASEEARYDAALVRGSILLELGDAVGALSCYEMIADPVERDPKVDCARGIALFELAMLPEARAALRSAVRGEPDLAEAHYTLGLIAELAGSGHETVHFREARRLDPERFPADFQYSRTEFEEIIEEAVSELPVEIADSMADYPIIVAELPVVTEMRRMDPPISPLSLAVFFGITQHSPSGREEHQPGLLLFKRNVERAFRDREMMVAGLRQTVIEEFAQALGYSQDELEEGPEPSVE